MLSYLSSFIWPEEEIKVDQKVLRQKYLVLIQIKDHRLRLKPINVERTNAERTNAERTNRGTNQKIPPHKRPLWKKMPVIL